MMIRTAGIYFILSFLLHAQVINDTTIIVHDSLASSDTSGITDTAFVSLTGETGEEQYSFPDYLSDINYLIEREIFLRNDYKYTGDLLAPFSFNFIKDLGVPGQPQESFIYGTGFDGISFLLDGILINNRLSNDLDLNLVQNEDIQSIEIIPSTRGFLYGPRNNPVTVNIGTRDFISSQPYSRIKYYQAPGGEAMVDGSFNALFSKNFQFAFDITNKKYDSSYTNTAFSIWQAKVKAKFFFSSNTFITATYNYVDKKTGLWGGVNRDSILNSGVRFEDLLYTEDEAPVNNSYRKQDDLLHSTALKYTSVQSERSRTEVSLYQQFMETKFNDSFEVEFDNTTWGLGIRQALGIDPISINASLNYERNLLEYWDRGPGEISVIPYTKRNENYFSAGGSVSFNILSNVVPSLFYKFNSITTEYGESFSTDNSGSGLGADLVIFPSDKISIYAGYSAFDRVFSGKDQTTTFESAITYRSDMYFADLRFFTRNNSNIFASSYIISVFPELYPTSDLSGIGLSSDLRFWYLQFETQASVYFSNGDKLYNVPDKRAEIGLYFRGNLFEDNLDLKSGLKFIYNGKINSLTEYYGLFKVDPAYRLDFLLSGEIRKSAIVFFTLENLLDNQYYVTPFYPMPGISARFGLAWEFLN